MKKIVFLLLTVCVLLGSFVVGCSKPERDKGEDFDPEIISQQVHEEKAGYVFCGYFYDEDFIYRVTTPVESADNDFYPKYQLDRAVALNCYNGNGQEYAYPSMELDFTVYATGYYDAYYKYSSVLPFYREGNEPTLSTTLPQQYLDKNKTIIEIILDKTGKNMWHNFHDEFEFEFSYKNEKKTTVHDVKWKSYIGEVKGVIGCWEYYIVDNSYAVIVGVATDEYYQQNKIETLTIPSTIEGKPVKEFSVHSVSYYQSEAQVKIGTLIVPGCIENFYLYTENSNGTTLDLDWFFAVDKIKFSEGVRTIRLITDGQEDLEIPSTAYYVDLQRPSLGYNEMYFIGDRDIKVNGGNHYYTDGTFLCTKEGDLVHQYANMHHLSVTINSNVKRVLRQSILGPFVKYINVPENVEYFDPNYNRFNWRDKYSAEFSKSFKDINTSPIIMVNSTKVAKQLLADAVTDNWYDSIHDIEKSIRFRFLQFKDGIDVLGLLTQAVNERRADKTQSERSALVEKYYEILTMPEFKIEDGVVYTKKITFTEGENFYFDGSGTYTKDAEWSIFAYLTDEYPKNSLEDFAFDQCIYDAIVYHGFAGFGDFS